MPYFGRSVRGRMAANMTSFRSLPLILVLLLASLPSSATEVAYPPGSRIGLAPPSGMVTSRNFFGFEDPHNNVAIIMVTLPGDAYAELSKTVTADALKQQGVTLELREPMSLSSGSGFLVIGRQEIEKTRLRKWILVASSPTLTALVTVQVPDTRAAALSRRCDPRVAENARHPRHRPDR